MSEMMTLMEKTVFMGAVEMFGGIPTEALAQIAARSTEVQVGRGQTLFAEGDEDQGVFIVVEGLVELRKGDVVVRLLRDGSANGELFLRENESHQYTAVARDDSHVLNLGRTDVIDALLENPEFGLAVVQDLARRHHTLTERVIELEKQLESTAAGRSDSKREEIEPAAVGPDVPQRRGWWRRVTQR